MDDSALYIPLRFWYYSNPRLALPFISLQFHDVKIDINTNAKLTTFNRKYNNFEISRSDNNQNDNQNVKLFTFMSLLNFNDQSKL